MLVRSLRWVGSNVLVPIAIAVFAFAVLEGGCRAGGRLRSGTWPVTAREKEARLVREIGRAYRPHPFLAMSGRPGGVIRVEGHEAHFNSLGLRGPEVERPKPEGRFRIVCEGGSTTFDLRASGDAATWPALLAGSLGPGWDVVNAGFPGWTSVQSLVSLELRDVDLEPDLVVVFAGINDAQPAGHVPFARDYSAGHGEILPRVLGAERAPLPLAARSVFVEWLRLRLGLLEPPAAGSGFAPAWGWAGGDRRDVIPEDAVAVFARNLRSIAAVAREHGAKTLLVAQAVRVRKGQQEADRAYLASWTPGLTLAGYLDALRRYNAAALALADGRDVFFADPFAEGDFSDEDFADPMHFSRAGAEKFSRRIAGVAVRIRAGDPVLPAANIRP